MEEDIFRFEQRISFHLLVLLHLQLSLRHFFWGWIFKPALNRITGKIPMVVMMMTMMIMSVIVIVMVEMTMGSDATGRCQGQGNQH